MNNPYEISTSDHRRQRNAYTGRQMFVSFLGGTILGLVIAVLGFIILILWSALQTYQIGV